ncbi:hypothetical protein BJ742DRAFT_812347 [Cladochytrium replicatum]|nr:hypothetical protein BJ742DRAFT_812347 [Cladochytrium replicatum]
MLTKKLVLHKNTIFVPSSALLLSLTTPSLSCQMILTQSLSHHVTMLLNKLHNSALLLLLTTPSLCCQMILTQSLSHHVTMLLN